VRGYNGDLGAEPQQGPGTEPLVRGPSPVEAKSFETFAHLKKVQKFAVDVRNLLNMALNVRNLLNMALAVSRQTQPSPVGPHQLITVSGDRALSGVQWQSLLSGQGAKPP